MSSCGIDAVLDYTARMSSCGIGAVLWHEATPNELELSRGELRPRKPLSLELIAHFSKTTLKATLTDVVGCVFLSPLTLFLARCYPRSCPESRPRPRPLTWLPAVVARGFPLGVLRGTSLINVATPQLWPRHSLVMCKLDCHLDGVFSVPM